MGDRKKIKQLRLKPLRSHSQGFQNQQLRRIPLYPGERARVRASHNRSILLQHIPTPKSFPARQPKLPRRRRQFATQTRIRLNHSRRA
jgi:hypothetical protein